MKVYNYHPEYKYLIGSEEAFESPLEPGVFLIPAHATVVKPPSCRKNMIQVFDGSSWNIVNNYLGIYYSTITFEKIENYNPFQAPENSTQTPPPEVPDGKFLQWNNGWILEDIPQQRILTPEEKLQATGLTIDELKQLLGL